MHTIYHLVSRQINRWNLEHQLLHKKDSSLAHSVVVKPVVTISRQRGALGWMLAKQLSEELQYGFFDRKIVDFIAQDAGVNAELVESLDERGRSELELWVQNLLSDRVFDYDTLIQELSKVVKATALQGGVVILGRGANFLLQDSNALHIRVVAPEEVRIQNIVNREGLTSQEARQEIYLKDRERANFVKRYFHCDIESPLAYDLVINTGRVSLEESIKIVLTALRSRGWSMEATGGDKRLAHVRIG
ncbi:MAG: AAA family ATPase [bacterium]|jgi:cytidylate kinase